MNIEKSRFNMIEQQIRPWNVLDQDILQLLTVVKREDYFPDAQKSLAFFDTELPLPDGGHAMTPKLEARIVQDLVLRKTESVLLIGAASGYLAALLAHQARHVSVIDSSAARVELAAENLAKNGVTNVDLNWCDGLQEKHPGSYDVIVLAGAVEFVPESLTKQLNPGGRLFAVVGQEPVMVAQLITRVDDILFKTVELYETVIQPLAAGPHKSRFKF